MMRIATCTLPAAIILMLPVPAAEAQSGAPPPASAPLESVTWVVEAGYATFWLRDVSRNTPRADASPVSLEGDGPAIAGRHDRANPKRLHRWEFSFVSTGNFSYDAIVRTMPRSPDEHAMHLGGRYEYRRYPFRDLWVDGLDVGIGVQGIGEYVSLARHLDPSITIDRSETRLGTAVVAAARFHRWRWVDAEVAWANGIRFDRARVSHSVGAEASFEQWGGGWLTDLAISGTVPISGRLGVRASYLGSAQGHYGSHDQYATGHRRFLAGVTYGR